MGRHLLDRLSVEDERILALEHGSVVGHWCKVVMLEGAIDLTRLRRSVAARLPLAPRLRQRLAFLPRGLGRPVWVDDPSFELSRHVAAIPTDAPLDDESLRTLIASRMQERLNRERPLWKLEVAPLKDGRTALLWRAHHCMADGFTAMRIGGLCIWSDGAAEPARVAPPGGDVSSATRAELLATAALDRGATVVRAASSLTRELSGVRRWRDGVAQLGAIAATARRELAPGPIASCFDAPVGRSRAVAWRALPLGAVHDAAKRVGPNVTLNDAMVALVGSGVAAWLAEQRRASQPLRVRIPVSLHAPDAAASANRDSFIDVDVSLDGSDVVARLRAIAMQTRLRKATHNAEHVDEVRRAMAVLPFGEHMVAMSDGPHQFSLCISNVVGPRQPIAVDGVAVRELHSFVEVAEHHDLRASVISCADRLSLSLCADADRVDPEAVMRGVDAAWDRLNSPA